MKVGVSQKTLLILLLVVIFTSLQGNVSAQAVEKPKSRQLIAGIGGGESVVLEPGETYYGAPFESGGGLDFFLYFGLITTNTDAYTDPQQTPYLITAFEYLNPDTQSWEPTKVYYENILKYKKLDFRRNPKHKSDVNATYRMVMSNPNKKGTIYFSTEYEHSLWIDE